MPARVVLLASGEGTTAQAVLSAASDPAYGVRVVALGTDRPGARALQRAEDAGVATFCLPVGPDRAGWDDRLLRTVDDLRPDLVVCAGFMRILAPGFVRRFRCVNTHPALLPSFPGAHAVRDALAYGVKVSGATVHLLDEGVDTGPVLAQVAVPVLPDDTEATLRARIQDAERPLFVQTVGQLARAHRGEP